jgi:hypothetical protein
METSKLIRRPKVNSVTATNGYLYAEKRLIIIDIFMYISNIIYT